MRHASMSLTNDPEQARYLNAYKRCAMGCSMVWKFIAFSPTLLVGVLDNLAARCSIFYSSFFKSSAISQLVLSSPKFFYLTRYFIRRHLPNTTTLFVTNSFGSLLLCGRAALLVSWLHFGFVGSLWYGFKLLMWIIRCIFIQVRKLIL